MNDALAVGVSLFALIALSVVILIAKDRVATVVWHIKNSPAKLAAQRAEFERRLRSPDWQLYAEYLQRPVPSSLQSAYTNPHLTARAHYFGEYYVTFTPIDREALLDNRLVPGVLAFAESDGDPLFLKAGPSASEGVFIAYHDGGGSEELAPSIEAFLSGLRNAA